MVKYILTLLILFLFSGLGVAQSWDYDKYPNRDVEFIHLDGDLRISENGSIEGDLLYRTTVLGAHSDSLVLHASRMNIIAVELNNMAAEYRVSDNLLVIYSDEPLIRGENLLVRIQYDTDPQFGIHVNDRGTIWTSNLPVTTQHWMPLFDHPRTAFTFELAFTHPSDYTVIATGRKGNTDLLSVDEATTLFVSNAPVPASSLTWVVGDLNQIGSTLRSAETATEVQLPSGFERRADPQIYIYSEIDDANAAQLLQKSAESLISAVNYFQRPYPYRDLHIVLLDHDYMETKSYGAGVIYLFRNRDNLQTQIERGIVAQWIGNYIREEQWNDADAIILLQALSNAELFEAQSDLEFSRSDSPYFSFSDELYNHWLSNVNRGTISDLVIDLQEVKSKLMDGLSGVLSWNDLAKLLYEHTGRNYMEIPSLEVFEMDQNDILFEYTARINWLEDENRIELFFDAISDPINELVTIDIEEVTITESRIHEVTFSGESDGVVVNLSPSVEYVKLSVKERDDLNLIQEKPTLFWIAQLRNDDEVSGRVEAARGLAGVTGNPDLQLALNDLLQIETHPEVFAEILSAMARLTAGASGTDERFIRYSSNQEHILVQKAATEALAYYTGNERVISRLRSIIIQSNDEDLRRIAIRSLAETTEPEQFAAQLQNLITREVLLQHVPFMLQLLAEKGEVETAVEFSEPFITSNFPHKTRIEVLRFLIRFDNSSSSWNTRIPSLLSDRNPAIRMTGAEALGKLSNQQRNRLIDEFIADEFDARVLRILNR